MVGDLEVVIEALVLNSFRITKQDLFSAICWRLYSSSARDIFTYIEFHLLIEALFAREVILTNKQTNKQADVEYFHLANSYLIKVSSMSHLGLVGGWMEGSWLLRASQKDHQCSSVVLYDDRFHTFWQLNCLIDLVTLFSLVWFSCQWRLFSTHFHHKGDLIFLMFSP